MKQLAPFLCRRRITARRCGKCRYMAFGAAKTGGCPYFFDCMFLRQEKPLRRVILHVDEDLHYMAGLAAPAEGGV